MTEKQISRREVLKALAAGAGAAAFAGMPAKWKTPVVQVGALPAHAQGSQQEPFIQITDQGYYGQSASYDEHYIDVSYYIPPGVVTYEAQEGTGAPGGCNTEFNFYPPSYPYSIDQLSGDAVYGVVRLVFILDCGDCSTQEVIAVLTDTNTTPWTDSTVFNINCGPYP